MFGENTFECKSNRILQFYYYFLLGKRRKPPCLALRSGKGPVPAPQTKASKVRMWQLRHAMGRTLICNDYHANS